MGYWGWRPLVFSVFISVWVIGCSSTQTNAPTSTPTVLPLITLTLRTPTTLTPSPTTGLPLITTLPHTPPPESDNQGLSRLPTPLPLEIMPPTCYTQVNNQILCLGTVQNRQTQTLTNLVIAINLHDEMGAITDSQQVTLPQRFIPPNSIAPYHALFTIEADNTIAQISVDAIRAEPAPDNTILLLSARNIQTEWQDSRFWVDGTVNNDTPTTAQNIQVIVTLYDAIQRVIAYRILPIGMLTSGESTPFDLVLTPQLVSEGVTYNIDVVGISGG